jgi:tRNA A-37 threonylcarbamoyl transferase component Bud32
VTGRSSLVRSVVLPPPYREALSPRQWRVGMSLRVAMGLLAIAIDVGIIATLSGTQGIDQDVLVLFGWINIPILALTALSSWVMLRWRPARRLSILATMSALEALSMIVWIQATGTVTSYFIVAAAMLILWYRMYFGWVVGVAYSATLLAAHLGAFTLEQLGVLTPESLFVAEPSTFYQVEGYGLVAISSITWIYLLSFVGANAMINRFREKERLLAEVEREAARVAEGIKHGRLTHTMLAGEYALGELLGRGAMGEIYAARRVSSDAEVAVKVLHAHLVDDETIVERFRREAQLSARIPEVHTARVFDVGVDRVRQLPYIAMEYLRGEDLGAFLRRRGPLAPGELVALARRIATALDAAHEAGVIHRDLKPQNIFLVESAADPADVRILDFGIAKVIGPTRLGETLTVGEGFIGTPAFMAPEQALGKSAQIGPASDRFALAAVLYRALTGRLPFAASDLAEWLREVVHVDPLPPSTLRRELPTDVDAVFVIAMAKDPASRYRSAAALVEDLDLALDRRLPEATRERARRLSDSLAEAATMAP